MENKKGAMSSWIIYLILTLVVIVFGAIMIITNNDFLSGFFSSLKNKFRFGF